MGFQWIRVYQFRNLENATIPVPSGQVFFIGENGQGKTNFLEAVYFLCYGSSFRTKRDDQLILTGNTEMAVAGQWVDKDLSREVQVQISQGKKRITVDKMQLEDRRELVETIPCVVFSHEDMEFVKGPPEMQRWFFNQTCSMMNSDYLDSLRSYSKIVKTRNAVLKDGRTDLLDVYNHQMVIEGLFLQNERKKTLEAFNNVFSQVYPYVSGLDEPVSIEYKPSWNSEDSLEILALLEKRRNYDLHLKTTTSGPHRDKFIFRYKGQDFSLLASTGQFRLISLVLRSAQAQMLAQQRNKEPIFLIDDVLLELDDKKRKKFLETLPTFSQAFYTFLPDEHVKEYIQGDRITYSVQNGIFYEESI